MRISFSVIIAGILLGLAGIGNDSILFFVTGLFGMGVVFWIFTALRYIHSGQWEIDRRLRGL